MAYKFTGRQVFKAIVNGRTYSIVCYSQGTRYGFRHVAFLNDREQINKACYYNRTWERFRYETVLAGAIRKLDTDKETKEKLHRILIDGIAEEEHEKAEKDIKEFETLWNGLSDKNKEHIRNGLGDNLIQTEEQAKMVTSVMEMMTLFQNLEDEQ